MKPSHPPVHQIELRIAALSELFNSMDPTPFHPRSSWAHHNLASSYSGEDLTWTDLRNCGR
jgi:hypothetical protein